MRQSRRMFGEYQSDNFNTGERYNLAYKRVKRIKGFYVHAMVYLMVNVIIVYANYHKEYNFWSWQTFSTPLFWGIGLLTHGLSVFEKNIFFGQNWEERKIRELMDKDESEKWE